MHCDPGHAPAQPGAGTITSIFYAIVAAALLSASGLTQAQDNWREYRSEHFVVYSAAEPERATAMLETFEQFRQVCIAFLQLDDSVKRLPVTIYQISDPTLYNSFNPEQLPPEFLLSTFSDSYLITGPGEHFSENQNHFFHAYVHYLLRGNSHLKYPLWLEEGIAEFYGMTQISGDRVVIGSVPEFETSWMTRTGVLSIKYLVEHARTERPPKHRQQFNGQSWGLYHFLTFGEFTGRETYTPQLTNYVKRYNKGASSREAFKASFERSYKSFDRMLWTYLTRRTKEVTATFDFEPVEIQSKNLDEAQYHYVLGNLAAATGNSEAAENYYLTALDINPKHSYALSELAVLRARDNEFLRSRDMISNALALNPEDPMILSDSAEVLLQEIKAGIGENREYDEDKLQLMQMQAKKAAELSPHSVEPYMLLAHSKREIENNEVDAVKLYLKAQEKMPWNMDIGLSIGKVLANSQSSHLAPLYLTPVATWNHDADLSQEAVVLLDGIKGQ